MKKLINGILCLMLILTVGCEKKNEEKKDTAYYAELSPVIEDVLKESCRYMEALDLDKNNFHHSEIIDKFSEALIMAEDFENDEEQAKQYLYGISCLAPILIYNFAMNGFSEMDYIIKDVEYRSQMENFSAQQLQEEIKKFFKIVPADYDFEKLTDMATVHTVISNSSKDYECDFEFLYENNSWRLFRSILVASKEK